MSLFSSTGGISPDSEYWFSVAFGSSGISFVYVLMMSLAISLNLAFSPDSARPKFSAIDLFTISCMLMVLLITVPLYMRSMNPPSQ